MFTVKEISGLKSLRAYNAYSTLILGMTMLPAYQGEHYESFLARLDQMPEADQINVIRNGARFVPLDKDDLEAMLLFCVDKNGIPITKESVANFNPLQIIEAIVAFCMEVSKFKIDLVTDSEKKN